MQGHASLCWKEPLPTRGVSLSSHLLRSLSVRPVCSAHLLSCDSSSASLLDTVYDKTSPSTLTKALKLDPKSGSDKGGPLSPPPPTCTFYNLTTVKHFSVVYNG